MVINIVLRYTGEKYANVNINDLKYLEALRVSIKREKKENCILEITNKYKNN